MMRLAITFLILSPFLIAMCALIAWMERHDPPRGAA